MVYSIRRYIGGLRKEELLTTLRERLSKVKAHGLEILSLDPNPKDGGVFVRFNYLAAGNESEALKIIEDELRAESKKHGGLPTWHGVTGLGGSPWLVRGSPWVEVRRLI